MINVVSLFSNIGIAETYLKEIGIDILVANEIITERCRMYKYFYPNCDIVNGDITNNDVYSDILEKAKNLNCKFLIATPPCQGMSIAGKMEKSDNRNSLIKHAINMIIDLDVEFALIENVPNM